MSTTPSRIISGVLGTNWRITSSDDPDQAPLFANEYSFASFAFTMFTLVAVFAPFPLATLPSILGKVRMPKELCKTGLRHSKETY